MTKKERIIEAYHRLGGNITQVHKELNVHRQVIYQTLRQAGIRKPVMRGKVEERKTVKRPKPRKAGEVFRYILSAAQNNTKPNEKVWDNLLALADYYGAEIILGSLSYDLSSYGDDSVKGGRKTNKGPRWHESLAPFIHDERIELAPGLVWCGETNILPTAKRPLSGMETYTQRASGIFPHTKFAMESVASAKSDPTKFNYTTGAVTQRNYIQKKAGQQAEFHHGYGGLLVEVDHRGNWWVRQLNADSNGVIYDLDVVAEDGVVYENEEGVEAITWGDIHSVMLDDEVRESAWGEGGMLDTLKTKYQFLHDLLAGTKINHHEWKNFYEQLRLYVEGWDSVTAELQNAAEFLRLAHRDNVQSVVVYSNHDDPWLARWLNETDYRKDPLNSEIYLRLALAKVQAIKGGDDVNLLEYAMREMECPDATMFLGCDESFTVCNKRIECGMHGHLGPNGSNGTPIGLSKMGRKANTAHTHSAGIIDGLYVAGSCTRLDMRFNKGPSSWSHSHVVTYPNGKRTIVTVWGGKWRA